ncbi:MAG: hypothetical protein ACXWE8_13150 [Solirubrobacterales bacterium]
MDASIAHDRVAGNDGGDAGTADSDEALFAGVRGHADAMIAWAGSPEALALDNGQLESRAMRDGLEFMRLLTQAHLDLRAAREHPRHDVTDADGDARSSCEDGHERDPGDDLRAGAHDPDRLPQAGQGEPVPAGRGAELG